MTTTRGTALKGGSVRKVENHCLRTSSAAMEKVCENALFMWSRHEGKQYLVWGRQISVPPPRQDILGVICRGPNVLDARRKAQGFSLLAPSIMWAWGAPPPQEGLSSKQWGENPCELVLVEGLSHWASCWILN